MRMLRRFGRMLQLLAAESCQEDGWLHTLAGALLFTVALGGIAAVLALLLGWLTRPLAGWGMPGATSLMGRGALTLYLLVLGGLLALLVYTCVRGTVHGIRRAWRRAGGDA